MVKPFPVGQWPEISTMDQVKLAWRDLLAARRNGTYIAVESGHYHSPVPSLRELEQDPSWTAPRTEMPGIDLALDGQWALLEQLASLAADIPFENHDVEGLRYRLHNPFFQHSDGLIYHLLLRHLMPRRIIEIGSGYSTALVLDTVDRFFDAAPEITAIEPNPERLLSLIRPGERLEIITKLVQQVDPTRFDALEAGDVLFIDSSHVSKTGSDVNQLFLEVIPRLAAGVWVHIHDIFWPDYPRGFIFGGMAWNEIYMVRALLVGNQNLHIRMWNSCLEALDPERAVSILPRWDGRGVGSIWLQTGA